ncbi:hypothetical protein, partial [Pseudomonas sp. MWU13-2105]|uniref:hypothetical protein n=1 Tax=Pseudomonas sp. MWU13-2105 TaxID=2935074 RepID=UPI0020100528
RYPSINSPTETVIRKTERGEIRRWKAEPGRGAGLGALTTEQYLLTLRWHEHRALPETTLEQHALIFQRY